MKAAHLSPTIAVATTNTSTTAATQAISASIPSTFRRRPPVAIALEGFPRLSREFVLLFGLLLAVVVAAFAIIYSQELHRCLLIRSQKMAAIHRRLQDQHGQLLLEQSALAGQARVQQLAHRRLRMRAPVPSDIVLLKEQPVVL